MMIMKMMIMILIIDKILMIMMATLIILLMATLRSAPSSIPSPTPDTISVSAQEGQSAFTSTPDQTIKKDFRDTVVILDTLVECTNCSPILDTTQQHWLKTNKHCFRYYDIFTFCKPYNLSRESFYSGSWRLIFDTKFQKMDLLNLPGQLDDSMFRDKVTKSVLSKTCQDAPLQPF